jgi:hypothetical protein
MTLQRHVARFSDQESGGDVASGPHEGHRDAFNLEHFNRSFEIKHVSRMVPLNK